MLSKPLYKKVIGDGNQDLVLLHGWGANSAIWNEFATALQCQFRITLIDLPGFGRSQHSPVDYSMDMVLSLLVPEIPKNSIIVGWSLGGMIATELALRYKQYVKGLITIASNPCFIAQNDWPGMAVKQFYAFAQQLHEDYSTTLKRFLALQFHGVESSKLYLRQAQSLLTYAPPPSINVLTASLTLLEKTDLRSSLSKIEQPMLALFGKMDAMVPKQVSEDLLLYNPHISTKVIEKAGHAAFISHLAECVNVINDWVKQYD